MKLTYDQFMLNQRWLHTAIHEEHEDGKLLIKIYGVRLGALVIASCLWVMLTLVSGFFSVAMVIVIGVAIGNAHLLLTAVPRWAHHSSALLLTLCGGLVANVLAGLALFSSKMGVSYWQVLTARRIPDDLPMLVNLFVESFRPADALFYALAVTVALFSARRRKGGWRRS
jgi:hypothetical protein